MRGLGRPIDPVYYLRGGLSYRINDWGADCHYSGLVTLTPLDLDFRAWLHGNTSHLRALYRELRKQHASR